jgi:DNA-directed RNA polymerase specialized sigma24 family protein
MTWEDLKDEPTESLIEYMKCKDDASYVELAQASYVALNFRFRGDVEDKARKIGKNWGLDRETCDQKVEEAFKRFYQYPFKFTKAKCTTSSIDNCVKLYLYRIVQNLFKDHHKSLLQVEESPYDGMEEVIIEFPELESLALNVSDDLKIAHQKMADLISNLPFNERVIYLTYKAYEKKGFKLPRILLKKMREVTGLKQSSIRVYKKQVFEKMNQLQKQDGE